MAVPTTTMHLTSGFASYEEFKNNVRDRIIQRTSDGSGLDIVYHDIHPDWAKDVIHFVDDNLERYGSR